MPKSCKTRWLLYCCVLCCITDLHILFIRVAHNGPGPTDGLCFHTVLLSQNVCTSRAITASWLSHTYPFMLLSCTQHCLVTFSTLCDNIPGPDLNLSVGASLLIVCAIYWGKGGVETCVCTYCQRRPQCRPFQWGPSHLVRSCRQRRGQSNSAKTAKTQPFQSP